MAGINLLTLPRFWRLYSGYRGCATQQGMVFASLTVEQSIQITVSLWNRGKVFVQSTLEQALFFACRNLYGLEFRLSIQSNCVACQAIPSAPFPIFAIKEMLLLWNRVSISPFSTSGYRPSRPVVFIGIDLSSLFIDDRGRPTTDGLAGSGIKDTLRTDLCFNRI